MTGTEVSKPLSAQEEFQKKIEDKLRKDIGELIPDTVLAEMVKKGVDNILFGRKSTIDSWGNTKTESQSWFEQEIYKIMQPQIKEQMKAYIENNQEVVKKAMEEVIKTQLPAIMAGYFTNALAGNTYQLNESIAKIIQPLMRGY